MTIPKAFYLLHFAGLAALSPYLVLYYSDLGLNPRQIGLLMGVPPMVMIVSGPLWSAVADATQRHKRVLVLTMAGSIGSVGLLAEASTFGWLIPAVALYALCHSPVIPLFDNAVLDLLGDRRAAYGRLRLWGAIGWGACAPVIGVLTEAFGIGWAFGGYAVLMGGSLLLAIRMPMKASSSRHPFIAGLRQLMRNSEWTVLLITVFVLGLSGSVVRNFLFLHLKQMGAGKDLMGLSLTFATMGELPIFFYSEPLLRRWGPRGLLVFAALAGALQAFLFSIMWVPWLVLPLQLLHGPAFSAMLTARIAYAKAIAPDGLGATAQGMLSAVSAGLASAFGAVAGGALYESLGAVATFRIASIGALCGVLFFILATRSNR